MTHLYMLTHAEAVATLHGWRQSRGAELEVHVAMALGMTVCSVEWWAIRDPETLEVPA